MGCASCNEQGEGGGFTQMVNEDRQVMEERTVLVVDDDNLVRWFFARVLDRAGYAVTAVPTVQEALSALSEKRFDLVITDMRMPGENGAVLVDRVSNMTDPPPVVVCSAFVSDTEQEKLLTQGVFAVLAKPFRIDEILAVVEVASSGAGGRLPVRD